MKELKSIRHQIEDLSYSQTKLIDLGFKKVRVTRMVYEYELETRTRILNNIYTQESIILKLETLSKNESYEVENLEEEGEYYETNF